MVCKQESMRPYSFATGRSGIGAPTKGNCRRRYLVDAGGYGITAMHMFPARVALKVCNGLLSLYCTILPSIQLYLSPTLREPYQVLGYLRLFSSKGHSYIVLLNASQSLSCAYQPLVHLCYGPPFGSGPQHPFVCPRTEV